MRIQDSRVNYSTVFLNLHAVAWPGLVDGREEEDAVGGDEALACPAELDQVSPPGSASAVNISLTK